MALNQFADWSEAEYKSILMEDTPVALEPRELAETGRSRSTTCTCSSTCGNCTCNDYGAARSDSLFDWGVAASNPKGINAQNPITDQGQCGSCWAFADAAALEIQHYIQNPSQGMLKFSEQQIIDCNPWGSGCSGGWPEDMFDLWMSPGQVHAIERLTYAAAPLDYIAGQNATCNPNGAAASAAYPTGLVRWYSATNAPVNYVNALVSGPLVLYIEADTAVWQGYRSGIINSSCCFAGYVLNHAVLLVGWKVTAKQSAWIIRNSWGTGWGVGGYAYVKMTNTGYGVCGEQYQGFGINMATVA